jgi:hypothetical protein
MRSASAAGYTSAGRARHQNPPPRRTHPVCTRRLYAKSWTGLHDQHAAAPGWPVAAAPRRSDLFDADTAARGIAFRHVGHHGLMQTGLFHRGDRFTLLEGDILGDCQSGFESLLFTHDS